MGKLIVIEGSDGSGKATQTMMLYEYLKKMGRKVRMVSFPVYESDSSALVKMYLGGAFGKDAAAINPYIASSFYAVDRFASFLQDWKDFYEESENNIVICDRYVTSNMLHQAAKINSIEEKEKFLDWEYDFEFVKGGLPVPDMVVFLNVKPETSLKLMELRANKITKEQKKDIHESNADFMRKSYENSVFLCDKFGWEKIDCCEGENIKSMKRIHDLIVNAIMRKRIIF